MKKILFISTAIMTVLMVTPVFAQDDDMMLQLKAMQEQMKSMQAEMNKLKSKIAKAEKNDELAKSEAVAANAMPVKKAGDDVKITMIPAPKFETADGAYSFKVGGILQAEVGLSNDDASDHPDNTNIRRARLNASGLLATDFNYKLEVDFAGNATAITDAFIQYTGFKPVAFTVGHFKEPFGMEATTPDIFTTFVETASPTLTFAPLRKIGAMVSSAGKIDPLGSWSIAAGAFGSGTSSVGSTDDEARDIAGRITWAPIAEKTQVLHLGVAGLHRIPDASPTDTFTFSARSENQLSTDTTEFAIREAITSVDSVDLLGLEAAAVYGPASLQGEYMTASVERSAGAEPTYNGYYVEGSYFLTGESRNYDAGKGVFSRVKPLTPLTSKGGYGAWAAMARYSNTDLNDKALNGGEMSNVTLGLRWIPNDYTLVSANYIMVNTDVNSVTANDDPSIFIMRAQVDF